MREYKSGTTWCFWRWTITDSDYIRRLHILKTPWFAICLHYLRHPDPEPFLHDHPVSFLSIILRGWYIEKRGSGIRVHKWFNWIRARKNDCHTIVSVAPGTVTLALMGPKIREWGFHIESPAHVAVDQYGTQHPLGWSMWKEYYARQRKRKQYLASPACNPEIALHFQRGGK